MQRHWMNKLYIFISAGLFIITGGNVIATVINIDSF